jgi:uncharacterized membrane protein YcaP (DUF421 family)
MDLESLFGLTVSPWELMIRGTAIYWFLFAIFRYVIRRDVGAIAVADVLLLVIIADAAQNAMAGGYESITDGFILIASIVAWNYALDWASFHFPAVRRFAEPKPLPLISHGRMLKRNLRREFLTPEDVESELRKQGVADISQVVSAYMEPDGEISVIRAEPGTSPRHQGRDRPV